jgi:probable phosphoglycerate mutase
VIALVRHGETQPNVAGALLGRTDVDLTEHGREQADSLARLLTTEPVVAVVSSPLRRAVATAAAIAAVHKLTVEVDERFIELDYGAWEGLTPAQAGSEGWRRWRSDPAWAPPGGESLVALQARVQAACRSVAGRLAGDDTGVVVVVSHVSPIKAAVAWALAVGPDIAWRMHLRLASVSRLGLRSGTPFVLTFDETGHLLDHVL